LVRKFVAPVKKFALHHSDNTNSKTINNNPKPLPVLNLDVTNGGLGVSCSKNGSLLIWLTENGQIRVKKRFSESLMLIYCKAKSV
jgi:hypothetical protein